MSFEDMLKGDAVNVFLNTKQVAELVAYLPKGVNPRSVRALVDRRRTSPATEDNSRTIVGDFEVFISRDPDVGVPSVSPGKDKVILAEYQDGPSVQALVVEILEYDPAMWKLSLRK